MFVGWLVLACVPSTALAKTIAFLDERNSHGGGVFESFREEDGDRLEMRLRNNGLDVTLLRGSGVFPQVAQFVFVAQGGGPPFAPGVYEVRSGTYHSNADGPVLFVFVFDQLDCDDFTGEFVVQEVDITPEGIHAFSADYVRYCDRDPRPRRGSIRFRAGDRGCVGVAEGTPCDDFDGCTAPDRCMAGVCVAPDVVTSTCAPGAACEDRSQCDPADGSCHSAPELDLTACDDGDPTTTLDACEQGTCVGCALAMQCGTLIGRDYGYGGGCHYAPQWDAPCDDGDPCTVAERCVAFSCTGTPRRCEDGDPCTVDACHSAEGGCTAVPIPRCWTVLGQGIARYSASGSIRGTQVSCSARCRFTTADALRFDDPQHYRVKGGTTTCPASGQPVTIPDETGDVASRRSGELRLRATNVEALEEALRQCVAHGLRLGPIRTRLRPTNDADTFRGTQSTTMRINDRLPIVVTSTVRLETSLRTVRAPVRPEVSRHVTRLRECAEGVKLRCRVD